MEKCIQKFKNFNGMKTRHFLNFLNDSMIEIMMEEYKKANGTIIMQQLVTV